jgi:hypothetical protein
LGAFQTVEAEPNSVTFGDQWGPGLNILTLEAFQDVEAEPNSDFDIHQILAAFGWPLDILTS